MPMPNLVAALRRTGKQLACDVTLLRSATWLRTSSGCPRFPGRDPKRPEEQRDCTSSPSRQAERGLRSF
ncbi:unnamed protein product [Pleuronectes platessa]|uniref:Uncharacterized protein n=1 Tax=Pleuronectes platessa TaxID=8262 RepID=A0A9N7UI47_PLEPL|nr:unnamed protein product [Pleuronectes platessa]